MDKDLPLAREKTSQALKRPNGISISRGTPSHRSRECTSGMVEVARVRKTTGQLMIDIASTN
jgi:hypothetical protein